MLFEYRIVTWDYRDQELDSLEDFLDAKGAEGWELVQVLAAPTQVVEKLFFKRAYETVSAKHFTK